MEKPRPKKEVAIRYYNEQVRHIVFYSTPDAVEQFRDFGSLSPASRNKNAYDLFVDARYDFSEVLNYIDSYGEGEG